MAIISKLMPYWIPILFIVIGIIGLVVSFRKNGHNKGERK